MDIGLIALLLAYVGAILAIFPTLTFMHGYSEGRHNRHDHTVHYARQNWFKWNGYKLGRWSKSRLDRASEARWQRKVKRGDGREARRLKGKVK